MSDALRDREIIVVGGAGGLGSATTELLAEEEARLVVSFLNNGDRAERFSNISMAVQADLTNADHRIRLLETMSRLYGLVIFAGDPARVNSPQQMEEAMRRSHEVNYLGPVLVAREAVERMRRSKIAGAIVLVSSMQAVVPFVGSTAYAGAKTALIQAGRILAKECRGPSNIRVNVVCPGANAAGMAQSSIASGKYDRYLSESSIGRFGKPLDVARAVRFFLEPDNYITGQVLTIDGGLTL